ncbi:hypothetical protein CY35_15G036100 [Sphagnum magellanicum]|nr:hypothetical protein CY35_15G036100 [Sphagnum magellanicum]
MPPCLRQGLGEVGYSLRHPKELFLSCYGCGGRRKYWRLLLLLRPPQKKAIRSFELNYNTNLQQQHQQHQQQKSAASHTSIRGRSILSLRSSSARGRLCHRVKFSFSSSVLFLFLRCVLSVLS